MGFDSLSLEPFNPEQAGDAGVVVNAVDGFTQKFGNAENGDRQVGIGLDYGGIGGDQTIQHAAGGARSRDHSEHRG